MADLFAEAGLCFVCGNPPGDGHLRRGMCRKHYERWRVHGDPTKVLLQMPENRGTPRHGTASRYNYGCRCEDCRTANRAYLRKWRAANPEKVREHGARWRRDNPATLKLTQWAAGERLVGLPPTEETVAYAKVLFGDPCSFCGADGGSIDHIVARVCGGDGEWTNLTAACGPCNSQKHTKSLLHFMLARAA